MAERQDIRQAPAHPGHTSEHRVDSGSRSVVQPDEQGVQQADSDGGTPETIKIRIWDPKGSRRTFYQSHPFDFRFAQSVEAPDHGHPANTNVPVEHPEHTIVHVDHPNPYYGYPDDESTSSEEGDGPDPVLYRWSSSSEEGDPFVYDTYCSRPSNMGPSPLAIAVTQDNTPRTLPPPTITPSPVQLRPLSLATNSQRRIAGGSDEGTSGSRPVSWASDQGGEEVRQYRRLANRGSKLPYVRDGVPLASDLV